MPYIVIEGFKNGLDKRRLEAATPAGALTVLKNANINRGEEIEKRKAFSLKYALPAGTLGMQALSGGLYVFGSGGDPGVPAGVTYQKLSHEDGASRVLMEVLGSDISENKTFVTGLFDNSDVRPFFDGNKIDDFLPGSGTFADDITVSGQPFTYKNKVYLNSETNMLFSGSGIPSSFDSTKDDGSGLIDVSTQVSNAEDIQGYADYQNSLAVFSGNNISRWAVDPDPDAYTLLQTLPGVFCVAPKTIVAYGDHDVFFLTASGMRSIRAINSSLSAGVTDVGTPIDDDLIAVMDTISDATLRAAVSVIEPKDERHLMALDDTIYAFTYFPSSSISSWSTWELGVNITEFSTIGKKLYARSGDNIYLYGGDDNDEYTTQEVVVELPYLDGRRLGDWKSWTYLDFIIEGTWDVFVNVEPNNPDYWVKTCVITKHSLGLPSIPCQQYGPVFKLKFVHNGDATESARISKLVVHYEGSGKR